jgi:hypothetical protein
MSPPSTTSAGLIVVIVVIIIRYIQVNCFQARGLSVSKVITGCELSDIQLTLCDKLPLSKEKDGFLKSFQTVRLGEGELLALLLVDWLCASDHLDIIIGWFLLLEMCD